MTCIVGIVDKSKVIIGADSAGVDSGYNRQIRKDTKVFKVGEFVIGCTSSFRMIQLLRYSLSLPEIGKKDIYQYMCTDFINSVRECFRNGGYLQKYTDGDEKGGSFLVGHKDRLFNIQDDFQVGENADGIDACGCGSNYALGAMFTHDGKAEDRVKKALEAACYFSSGCYPPFVIEKT